VKVVRKLFLKRATLNKRKAAFKVAKLNKESPKAKFTEDDFIVIDKSLLPIREDVIIDRIYKRSK
jgi:hypothetical protein